MAKKNKESISINLDNGDSITVQFPLQWADKKGCYKEDKSEKCHITKDAVYKCPNEKMIHTCKHPVNGCIKESWDELLSKVDNRFNKHSQIEKCFRDLNKRNTVANAYQEIGEAVIKAPKCIYRQKHHKSIGFVGQDPYPGVFVYTKLPQNEVIKNIKTIFRPESESACCSDDFLNNAYLRILSQEGGHDSVNWLLPYPYNEGTQSIIGVSRKHEKYTSHNTNIERYIDNKRDTTAFDANYALLDLFILQLRQVEECILQAQRAPANKMAEYRYWYIGFISLYQMFKHTNLKKLNIPDDDYLQKIMADAKDNNMLHHIFETRRLRQRIELIDNLIEQGVLRILIARKMPKTIQNLINETLKQRDKLSKEQELLSANDFDPEYSDFIRWRIAYFYLINDAVIAVLRNDLYKYNQNSTNDKPKWVSDFLKKTDERYWYSQDPNDNNLQGWYGTLRSIFGWEMITNVKL